jgi:hypothetical protein
MFQAQPFAINRDDWWRDPTNRSAPAPTHDYASRAAWRVSHITGKRGNGRERR